MKQIEFIKSNSEFKKTGNNYIEIISTKSNLPSNEKLKQHYELFSKLDDFSKLKFEVALNKAIKKVNKYFTIVDSNFLAHIPSSAWQVYLLPSSDSVAGNTYSLMGSSYVTLDIETLYNDSQEQITQYLIHEFLHLLRFRQISKSIINLIPEKLNIIYSNIQIGYSVHSLKNYIISDLNNLDWYFMSKIIESKNYDFIRLIKNCPQEAKNVLLTLETSNLNIQNDSSFSKLSSLNSIVEFFEDLFGQDWINKPEFIEFANLKIPLLIQNIKSRKVCEGVNFNPENNSYNFSFDSFEKNYDIFNEIDNEFTARIVGLKDILNPTEFELGWLSKNGGYTDLETIDLLCDLYLNANDRKTRMYFLRELYKFQIECKPVDLIEFIKKNFQHSSYGERIYQNLSNLLYKLN